MKISYSWLKDFISTDLSAQGIAALLTSSGLEVEHIENFEKVKGNLDGMVIGEVLSCTPHPDAEKLKLTTVDIGLPEPKQIVCGAANVAAGQKVVVATEGAQLYPTQGEPFKIKKSKIRGAASEGMICAEDEIGLGHSHEGIMVLDTELPNGTPAAAFFNLEADQVFEIGLTPNRADAASHFGVARDLRALTKQPLQFPDISSFTEKKGTQLIQIENQAPAHCLRYSGISINNVVVKPSPEWLQLRLKAIGIIPQNNVVDATNYVLHELGQPLHAFDAAAIVGNKIIIKEAEEGEPFITLDGVERTLRAQNLMICNAEAPMVIAGVFGGKAAAVTQTTERIFLESAYFSPVSIRKTAQQLGLKTDSSFRYERGTDPNMVITALKRAALLICELTGGHIASEITDLYPEPVLPCKIDLNLQRLFKLIGQEIDLELVRQILENLDIKITATTAESWQIEVPPYRVDVTREADIAEEILRIYGYNTLPLKPYMSAGFVAPFQKPDPELLKEKLADSLSSAGFSQIITNSLSNSAYYTSVASLPEKERVNILNYNSEELNIMRQTMLFSGIEVLQHNINRKQRDLKLYEFGTTYHQSGESNYTERQHLAFFMSGNKAAESWQQKSTPLHFTDLSAAIARVFQLCGAEGKVVSKQLEQNELLSGGLQFELNGKPLGFAGKVAISVLQQFGLKEDTLYAELNWEYLSKKYQSKLTFDELPRFPEVRRDLSLMLDKKVSYQQIKELAQRSERKLLKQINLFDVYEGDKIEAGKKSYSVSFILQDTQQTLTDKVIDQVMKKITTALEQELGAELRK